MIPLYYMDDTVRRKAEFAEKWRLYHSFLDGVTLSGGGEFSSPILLPSFPGGADIRAELVIRGEGAVARTTIREVVVNNAVPR